MASRESIDKLMAEPDTDAELKHRLELVTRAREFASRELALPDNDSYRSYVDTGRKFVTWNVIATEEFSVAARNWCFPVAGCVPYRGYYSRDDAQQFADGLQAQGLDVFVNGSSAYSTLGWFDDPVLNTMLIWRETRLVGVIFHELAHQQVWVKDDTTFNESFAVFVQREGVRRWLDEHGSDEQRKAYTVRLRRRQEFVHLLLDFRARLEALYVTDLDTQSMRIAKVRTFDELRARYDDLKSAWGGYDGYDEWFERPVNNARFALIATYNEGVDAIAELFAQEDGDFARFYARIAELAAATPDERSRQLGELPVTSSAGAGS